MEIASNLQHLREALAYITSKATEAKASKDALWRLQLASEEAIVNIMRHGYKGSSGTIEIECKNETADRFQIKISDFGTPFDPTVQKNEKKEEFETSGFGIELMRQVVDKVSYIRSGSKNVLILTCNL
jgi:anti-sigma regulatory factor (Ser/Thr protein kinase)